MKEERTIFYYLLLSILAVLLILIMVFLQPSFNNSINIFDKFFLAGAFFISCIFGISIAIYPNWWRKNKTNTTNKSNLQKSKTNISFQGHHPDCNMFQSHTIIIKDKTRCAGCLGLIIGALASISLIILYLIFPFSLSIFMYHMFLLIGILGLFFIYIEILFLKRRMFFHILLNIFFILSFFIITINVLEITKNMIFGILTVLLCFLWLDARIHFSKYKHKIICASCKQSCKSF